MDAASLMEVVKSAALMAAWLTSSVAIDDSPACPLKCKTQCESCVADDTQDAITVMVKKDSEGTVCSCLGADDDCATCHEPCDQAATKSCPTAACETPPSGPHAIIYFARTTREGANEKDCTHCFTYQTLSVSAMPVGASASLSSSCCAGEKKTEDVVLHPVCPHRRIERDATQPCGDCSTEKFVRTNGVELLGRWMAELISGKPKVTARLAVHGVVPEIELPAIAVGHKKICAGGRCYEVDEATVEGKTCDQPKVEETAEDEPIIAAPVPPPLPTSYQFADVPPTCEQGQYVEPSSIMAEDFGFELLNRSNVSVPAGVLVRLMVENTAAKTKLEMTQALMEERSAVMEHVMALMERNAQLQTQIAVMESRQHMSDAISANVAERLDAALRTTPQVESSEWTVEEATAEGRNQIDTIQEDLANIRRQIAIIKRNQPVPFAPSYVGTPAAATSNPWRTARVTPYVPIVAPVPVAKESCTDPACTAAGCNK